MVYLLFCLDRHPANAHLLLCSRKTTGAQPPQGEDPPDEEAAGDEEADITPPPTTPTSLTHTRRSAPYSYISSRSSRSRRAGSPSLTATTLDTGYTSAGTTTTAERRLTRLAMSGMPLTRHTRSRAISSCTRRWGGSSTRIGWRTTTKTSTSISTS